MSRKKAHLSKFVSLYFYSQVCIPQTRRVETPCHTSTGTLLTYVRHRHVTYSPTSIVEFRYFLLTYQSDNVLLQEGQPFSTCCGSVFVEKEKKIVNMSKKRLRKKQSSQTSWLWRETQNCVAFGSDLDPQWRGDGILTLTAPNKDIHTHTHKHMYAWSFGASVWRGPSHLLPSVSCIFRWKYRCHADLCWPWHKCPGLLPLQEDIAAFHAD